MNADMTLRLFLLGVSAIGPRVAAQAPNDLRAAIAAADSALFTAYNRRDLAKLQSFFTPDLEFYQDNEGVENYRRL